VSSSGRYLFVSARLNEDLLAIRSRDPFTGFFVTHSVAEAVFLSSRIVVLGSPQGETATVLYDGPPPVPDHLLERVWHHSEDVVMRATEPGVLEPGAG
jgi:ABC-type nitrate/sulfonate/bicarbonate transport system ATPase subunit